VLDAANGDATLDLLPAYLRDVYRWAYLTPWLASYLDRQIVVQAILWGNAQHLIGDVLAEIKPGDRVFQPAAVYGDFSRQVADRIGPQGRLHVRDIAPLQVDLTRRKLADRPQVFVSYGDAADPNPDEQCANVVACFFLLHEVPDEMKLRITSSMLQLVAPGGKAVFVDYHRPNRFHPLKPLMRRIFAWLEPFASSMWLRDIRDLSGSSGSKFRWCKRTRFGEMYQIVVAERF
jgi:ubiquinone/menaquinone biosynthesis C-methylase UbiE